MQYSFCIDGRIRIFTCSMYSALWIHVLTMDSTMKTEIFRHHIITIKSETWVKSTDFDLHIQNLRPATIGDLKTFYITCPHTQVNWYPVLSFVTRLPTFWAAWIPYVARTQLLHRKDGHSPLPDHGWNRTFLDSHIIAFHNSLTMFPLAAATSVKIFYDWSLPTELLDGMQRPMHRPWAWLPT